MPAIVKAKPRPLTKARAAESLIDNEVFKEKWKARLFVKNKGVRSIPVFTSRIFTPVLRAAGTGSIREVRHEALELMSYFEKKGKNDSAWRKRYKAAFEIFKNPQKFIEDFKFLQALGKTG